MIRKTILCAAALCLGLAAFAQDAKKPTKVRGFLIDNMCVTEDEEMAKGHPTACAKMDKCEKSGFAVVQGEKAYKLDAKGNERAAELVKSTKTQKGMVVEVEGTLEGDVLHADTINEVF